MVEGCSNGRSLTTIETSVQSLPLSPLDAHAHHPERAHMRAHIPSALQRGGPPTQLGRRGKTGSNQSPDQSPLQLPPQNLQIWGLRCPQILHFWGAVQWLRVVCSWSPARGSGLPIIIAARECHECVAGQAASHC